ncbi:unnamed protein product [Mytilus coruscus]|uniref:Uncharacterized protein n=1 Tax=Mytilus coruscus TaxID=42192 RepID=A0A6J8BCZ1_MYTCO|nr:unnamed protein product [Mytilus coruscus]
MHKFNRRRLDLEMYDFGWVVDKNVQKNQSVNQETLNRCSRWVVNNLNPDENALQLNDVFDSDFVEDLKTKETDGDKNRLILRHLHDSGADSDFDKFIVGFKPSKPNVANRINSVKNQVRLSRKTKDTDAEDNFASDFDPDFEKKEGTICVVSKLTGKSWKVVPIEASEEHPKANPKLPSGNDNYQYSEHLVVVSKTEQGEDSNNHGYLKYNVHPGRLSLPRSWSLVVNVQKPLDEIIGNFPYTLDVPVKALAKFIAWQLSLANFNSTKWVKLGGYPTDCDSHLYHQIC